MPLMGSLYVGSSGLRTSQNALNTTGHNLANADTTGYVRQQVLLGNKSYNTISNNIEGISKQQVGLGVDYTKVRQVRDAFLDQKYRKESGRSAFYEASSMATEEVENLLGELDGVAFAESLGDLNEAIQELSKTPADATAQGTLMERASAFLERASSVYAGLTEYQDNLNLQVKANTDRINEIGKQIKIANDAIRKIEASGTESANDLRDARNQLLDELSTLAKISYKEDTFGNVVVKLEGADFVTRDEVYKIELDVDIETGFYTPFWPQNAKSHKDEAGNIVYDDIENAKVFDLKSEINSALETDIGGMKAILLARGDHRADYTDLSKYGNSTDAEKEASKEYYNDNIAQSIMMNVQAEFDQLVHGVVTSINNALKQAAESEGDFPDSTYMRDEEGNPWQIFQKKSGSGFDADGNYIPEDPNDKATLYSIENLCINSELYNTPTKLGFRKSESSEDMDPAMELLKDIFTSDDYKMALNPNLEKKCGFIDYYSDLVSQLANSGSAYRGIVKSQDQAVQMADAARQQIMGVSTDEELTNMIKFQNAYNASSRYINVVNEMLEHILTALG